MGKGEEVLQEILRLQKVINSGDYRKYGDMQKYIVLAELNALNTYYNILKLKDSLVNNQSKKPVHNRWTGFL